jgi:proline dehydrogenase
MIQSLLTYFSKAAWAQRMMTASRLGWRIASRFVAGTKIDDAISAIRDLNVKRVNVTLDHLGEHTSKPEEASDATAEIVNTLDAIKRTDVRANVSIKLTQIGLGLDERLCSQNLERILSHATETGNFIRIDMEDTPYTDKTINLYYQMRKNGYANVGLVLQSYLFRSEGDARRLLADNTHIRLVKGAYNEGPDKAFPNKADANANYDLLAKIMIDAALTTDSLKLSPDGRFPPLAAFGTHDEHRIEFAKLYALKVGLPKDALEFQMLYGIRRDLQDRLVQEGYPVRIYVPFGTHWYPYFMRRLAERPANLWFFATNFLRG